MAHAGGRPLKFASVEELQTQIDAYFAACDPHPEQVISYEFPKKTITDDKGKEREVTDYDQEPQPVTRWHVTRQKEYSITGLANYLHTSRATLVDYEERDEFFNTIKAAKDKIEEFWEHMLIGPNVTGVIFNLKNNYGWRDQQNIDHTTKGDKLPTPILGGASNKENDNAQA